MQTAYGGSATTRRRPHGTRCGRRLRDWWSQSSAAVVALFSGVLFGALIMACLINGMTLMAVSPEHKFIARGAVLSCGVDGRRMGAEVES